MLDMAKIEAGKLELNYERVDVTGTVEDCVRMLRDRAENNGLELTLSLPNEPLFLIADRRAVKQVLLNLLTNAIKFTPAGGHVGVGVRYGDGLTTITVRDTGVGIPEAELPRLGNPFEQVNIDPMLAKGGSGLGLALVRALMEKTAARWPSRARKASVRPSASLSRWSPTSAPPPEFTAPRRRDDLTADLRHGKQSPCCFGRVPS